MLSILRHTKFSGGKKKTIMLIVRQPSFRKSKCKKKKNHTQIEEINRSALPLGYSRQTVGSLKCVGVLSVVEELPGFPCSFTPLCWAAGNGAAFSAFPLMLPAIPVRCQTQWRSVWAHRGFPFACENSTLQIIRKYFYNLFWIKLSLPWGCFFYTWPSAFQPFSCHCKASKWSCLYCTLG